MVGMQIHKRGIVMLLVLLGALGLGAVPALAGETILSVNAGSGNTSWFISGEPSLVMNGFDLQAFDVALPAVIDAVTIAVDSPVPTVPVELVIYQDSNGGSPIDAQLLASVTYTINSSGSFRAVLPTPVTVTQRAVWVGFYLPVDFSFFADTSGSSVFTYWAWTPGSTFALSNLANAQVFGPADGSAPVNINLNGKARITAEITGSNSGGFVTQTAGTGGDLAVMQPYPNCQNLSYDTGDELISLDDIVNLSCQITPSWQSPTNPIGYVQRGELYDIVIFKRDGVVVFNRLDIAVTHCIRPTAEDLATAVIGNGYGAPRSWRILPTQRFGDLICAEIRYGGKISYFVPGV